MNTTSIELVPTADLMEILPQNTRSRSLQYGVIPNIYPDVRKLASVTGIKKRVSFEEGILATIASIKANLRDH